MKRNLLASLALLALWTGTTHAQPTLGAPIVADAPLAPACASCARPAVFGAHLNAWPGGCANKICHSGFGQLAREMLAPIRLVTGNLLPFCHGPMTTRQDVERMIIDGHYSPAEITAAKIKVDESQAEARRIAVRYLAGVNCHYYPEAESGLIAALRADRCECVRLEAALAIGACNCVTAKLADALNVAASGCETDGNPAELSERVRNAARLALSRYQARGFGMSPQMLPPPDWTPPVPAPDGARPNSISIQALSGFAPAHAAEVNRAECASTQPSFAPATGQKTLYHLLMGAMGPREARPTYVETPTRPTIRPLGLSPLGSEVNLSISNE